MKSKFTAISSAAMLIIGVSFGGGLHAEEPDEARLSQMADNAEFFKLVKRAAPEYPARALRRGKEGFVVIQYNINPDGKVVEPQVVKSEPPETFDKAAVAAIKKWRYKADFKGAEPDMALARTRMRFALE